MTVSTTAARRFEIALSFPGEHREFVKEVAERLAEKLGEERVLYDKFHDAEFARLDLNIYLPALYRKDSELIVIFLCSDYVDKQWCRLEWRHISQLIVTTDARRIMFLSFGNPGDLSEFGILSGDGYIDIEPLSSEIVTEKIVKRLNLNNHGFPPPSPVLPALSRSIFADISRIDKYAPDELIGRETEIAMLDEAWVKVVRGETSRPHILSFIAFGGEGKTSLVAKWTAELAYRGWPGCDIAFAWSFYSQGTSEQAAASSDLFLREALIVFGDRDLANSNQGSYEKARRLARLVGEQKALLILDGLEPLQYSPTSPTPGEIKDQGIVALLKALATSNRGLCIVTSRHSIPELRAYWKTCAPEIELKRLSQSAGIDLLKKLGITGLLHEFATLVEDVRGHALTLSLLGSYLQNAHGGDIRKRDLIKLEDADAEEQGGHVFQVMGAYERWFENDSDGGQLALAIIRLFGLFDRPASADCLAALFAFPAILGVTDVLVLTSARQRDLIFSRLRKARILTLNRDSGASLVSIDAHPLLREYFAKQMREQKFGAWRAAHQRLYESLCKTASESATPTLDDLQPLYQAVMHGCRAGLEQDACDKVYHARILQGSGADGFYSTRRLGAFASDLAALACFFEEPWHRVSPSLTEGDRAWLQSVTSFNLTALGRLHEALELMRSGRAEDVKLANWKNATRSCCNLGELELTLGSINVALDEASAGVQYATLSGSAFEEINARAVRAYMQFQAGDQVNALVGFRVAESLQRIQLGNSLLYSLAGAQYCQVLLADAERVAWMDTIYPGEWHSFFDGRLTAPVLLNGVSSRAMQALRFCETGRLSIHTIGLALLEVGRTTLVEAILLGSPLGPSIVPLEGAVASLRQAGQAQDVPRGLLARAWLRVLTNQSIGAESGQADLDDASEIATRGQMPLLQADIHLYRARLFGPAHHAQGRPYPWQSPQFDLSEARRLIEKHGYWRRKGELEDAELAAKNWQ